MPTAQPRLHRSVLLFSSAVLILCSVLTACGGKGSKTSSPLEVQAIERVPEGHWLGKTSIGSESYPFEAYIKANGEVYLSDDTFDVVVAQLTKGKGTGRLFTCGSSAEGDLSPIPAKLQVTSHQEKKAFSMTLSYGKESHQLNFDTFLASADLPQASAGLAGTYRGRCLLHETVHHGTEVTLGTDHSLSFGGQILINSPYTYTGTYSFPDTTKGVVDLEIIQTPTSLWHGKTEKLKGLAVFKRNPKSPSGKPSILIMAVGEMGNYIAASINPEEAP